MTELRLGYIQLTDAAPLIVAAELGFAARRGLTLVLAREASWATLRDKLALGVIDAAHMLAPLAIATSLGLGPGPAVPMTAPLALNLNGNAVTASARLWAELAAGDEAGPAELAAALGGVVRRRRADGRAPLALATVFPYSTHTYLLRQFLRTGGLDPDEDVRMTVVPPPYMADALRDGAIDGFCVGSPWNSVAVEAGWGRILALGRDIVADAPEKVLAWPRGRLADDVAAALVAAVAEAGRWCAEPTNVAALATLLSRPEHLDVAAGIIRRTFDGRLLLGPGGPTRSAPDYLRFGDAVHRPRLEHAGWLFDCMAEAGQVAESAEAREAAMAVYGGVPEHSTR